MNVIKSGLSWLKIIHTSDWRQNDLICTYSEAVAMVQEEGAGLETGA
jgi:hypothetical protein